MTTHVDMHMSMKKVNALELRQSLGKVIAQLEESGEPILVEKGRRPVAVLISLKDFRERFSELDAAEDRDELIRRMEELAASAPVVDRTPVVEMIRRMRGYED